MSFKNKNDRKFRMKYERYVPCKRNNEKIVLKIVFEFRSVEKLKLIYISIVRFDVT